MNDERGKLTDYSWRDAGGGFCWELIGADGEALAEVNFEEDQWQRWSWYVPLSEDWHYDGGANPSGLAKSAGEAKAICEAVLVGTILGR